MPIVQPPLEPVIASGHVVALQRNAARDRGRGRRRANLCTEARHLDRRCGQAALLLGSKAIAFPNAATGAAAGVSFNETLKKLGIADTMKPKIKIAQGGRGAMELLAKGEVDIGLTFISEIITEPGVEVVGPLSRDISTPTALVGFVSAHSKEPEAAKALLRYLSSPAAAAVYTERGRSRVAERSAVVFRRDALLLLCPLPKTPWRLRDGESAISRSTGSKNGTISGIDSMM